MSTLVKLLILYQCYTANDIEHKAKWNIGYKEHIASTDQAQRKRVLSSSVWFGSFVAFVSVISDFIIC